MSGPRRFIRSGGTDTPSSCEVSVRVVFLGCCGVGGVGVRVGLGVRVLFFYYLCEGDSLKTLNLIQFVFS